MIHDLTDDLDVREALSPAQVLKLDQDLDAHHLAAELPDQTDRGRGGTAGRKYIIDDQHLLARFDRVRVDLKLVGSVLELVRLTDRLPRQLSGLADRNEAGVELDRNRRAGDETCLLYTSPSPRDRQKSRMPSSA